MSSHEILLKLVIFRLFSKASAAANAIANSPQSYVPVMFEETKIDYIVSRKISFRLSIYIDSLVVSHYFTCLNWNIHEIDKHAFISCADHTYDLSFQ